MDDRFKFNAVVSSYYDIDTPEEYKEVEPQFYLKNVDVFCTGEIGVDYDTLLDAVKEQSKDLTEKEIGQIMQHFEDNSNSPECDFVTITPDKILQCTGLKDKNGKLIYEGDLLKPLGEDDERVEIVWNEEKARLGLMIQWTDPCYWNGLYEETKTGRDYYDFDDFYIENFEVIGNIYENKELLNDN